jgi:hypothetical protein
MTPEQITALKSTFARMLATATLLTTMDVPALVKLGNTLGEDLTQAYGEQFKEIFDDFVFEELLRHQNLLIAQMQEAGGAEEAEAPRIHLIN